MQVEASIAIFLHSLQWNVVIAKSKFSSKWNGKNFWFPFNFFSQLKCWVRINFFTVNTLCVPVRHMDLVTIKITAKANKVKNISKTFRCTPGP